MDHRWKAVPIAHVAKKVSRPESVDSSRVYRLLGAHWYAKGLYVKDEKPGMEIRAGERIMETGRYQGVRARFIAYLDTARIPMQIDVGFGDPLVPGPSLVRLPTVLDLPPPELQGYSRESTIAEKLQAMVYLGEINSRMKDFYDIWLLATHFDFEGTILAEAIHETFRWRGTPLPRVPVAFSDAFAQDRERQVQWIAFIGRHRLEDTPATLHETVQVIAGFLQPVIQALYEEQPFDASWPPGGPWS